jgi:hypothetical protein
VFRLCASTVQEVDVASLQLSVFSSLLEHCGGLGAVHNEEATAANKIGFFDLLSVHTLTASPAQC